MTAGRKMSGPRREGTAALGLAWYRIAVVYFAIAVVVGVLMGASGNMSLYSVHSHLNLVGWVSLAVMGLVYEQVPGIARNRIARAHFWLYNAGLPVMMLALAGKELGYRGAEALLAVGSSVVAVAVLLFAANVLVWARGDGFRPATEGCPPD